MGITTKGAENSAFFKISLKKVVMIHPGIKKARGIDSRDVSLRPIRRALFVGWFGLSQNGT